MNKARDWTMPRIWFLLTLLCTVPALAGIHRWTDGNGVQNFTDVPPPGAVSESITGTTPAKGPLLMVKAVIDGDTFELADGRRVRLIGINAPEVAHYHRAGEEGGRAAAEFLKRTIEGKAVRLVPGAQRRDKYKRLLAHAFTQEGVSLNGLLLRHGLAHVSVHPPNIRYTREYLRLEQEARAAQRGVWKLARYRVKSAADAERLRHRFQRIKGTVSSIRTTRKYIYLLLDNKLPVVVAKSEAPVFAGEGVELHALTGHTVTVRGWLHTRRGKPALRLYHPIQFEAIR